MKVILALFILLMAAVGYFNFPKISSYLIKQPGQQLEQPASTKISSQQAVENVKNLLEVQEYLKEVPHGRVELDNEEESEYNVHVYEIKNGHTATFNWYRVSVKDGKVRSEFPTEQNPEERLSKVRTGTISGKLCYPSEILPKGVIEAKSLPEDKIFTQDYPGSQNGGKTTYEFELEEGNYYLRYVVAENLIGYSTTVCPTGHEQTCGDTKQRELAKAAVKPNSKVTNYNLCDFYYKSSNAPKF